VNELPTTLAGFPCTVTANGACPPLIAPDTVTTARFVTVPLTGVVIAICGAGAVELPASLELVVLPASLDVVVLPASLEVVVLPASLAVVLPASG
jgi:hypothetical protein